MTIGTIFDTPFERGCIVTVAPDPNDPTQPASYLALDSDGVECLFLGNMPVTITGHKS